MARFTVNASHHDPYKDFKFRLKWDGRYVAGISKVSALKRTTEVIKHRDGADPGGERKSPGASSFEPITLQRGLTQDGEFEKWALMVSKAAPLKKFQKDVRLEVLDDAGQLVLAYTIFGCWPSQYQAVPDLDDDTLVTEFEAIVLENEGWERVTSVSEPTGPVGRPQSRSARS